VAEESAPAPKGRLQLAVAVGLAAAMTLGGGGMVWNAWRITSNPFDCAGMTQDDCAMEQDIAMSWAKTQNNMGLILAVVGIGMGLTLWLTERRRDTGAPPKE
jgi:hypothetical protein